jgi:hypothetical protein
MDRWAIVKPDMKPARPSGMAPFDDGAQVAVQRMSVEVRLP